jgi:hypothetical protein
MASVLNIPILQFLNRLQARFKLSLRERLSEVLGPIRGEIFGSFLLVDEAVYCKEDLVDRDNVQCDDKANEDVAESLPFR